MLRVLDSDNIIKKTYNGGRNLKRSVNLKRSTNNREIKKTESYVVLIDKYSTGKRSIKYIFEDSEGNCYQWDTHSKSLYHIRIGNEILINFKIKYHAGFSKTYVINRVKLIGIPIENQ